MIQVQPASFLSWFLPLNAWRKTVQSNDRDTFPALYSMPLAPDFLLHAHTILNNGQQQAAGTFYIFLASSAFRPAMHTSIHLLA